MNTPSVSPHTITNGATQSQATPTTQPPGLEHGIATLIQMSQQTNHTLTALVEQIGALTQTLTAQPVATQHPIAPPAPAQSVAPSGEWQKALARATCAEVGISKTRSLNKWKILFYLRGVRKPAALYGHNGHADLIRFMSEVWPEITDDHFSEEQFNHENKIVRDLTPSATYTARYTVSPFLVDYYDGPPKRMDDGRMMTFRYAERASVLGG